MELAGPAAMNYAINESAGVYVNISKNNVLMQFILDFTDPHRCCMAL